MPSRTCAPAPPVELEVFGHGALCMCYSGQCFLSAVLGGDAAATGACAPSPAAWPSGGRGENPSHPLSLKDLSWPGPWVSWRRWEWPA